MVSTETWHLASRRAAWAEAPVCRPGLSGEVVACRPVLSHRSPHFGCQSAGRFDRAILYDATVKPLPRRQP